MVKIVISVITISVDIAVLFHSQLNRLFLICFIKQVLRIISVSIKEDLERAILFLTYIGILISTRLSKSIYQVQQSFKEDQQKKNRIKQKLTKFLLMTALMSSKRKSYWTRIISGIVTNVKNMYKQQSNLRFSEYHQY